MLIPLYRQEGAKGSYSIYRITGCRHEPAATCRARVTVQIIPRRV